jgi:hypothetical protein
MKASQQSPRFMPVPPEKAMEVYLGLRNQALTSTSAKIGLKNIGPDDPIAVLMDLNTGDRNATIAAFADGAASIYISNGGGFIGGGQDYPSVREAGQNLIAVARRFRPRMQKTQNYPLPQKTEVFFYLITDNGVYTVSAPEAELHRRTHALTDLYAAGQEVITQYRLNTAKR